MKLFKFFSAFIVFASLGISGAWSSEFTADMVVNAPMGISMTGKMYIKENLHRQDISVLGQNQSIITDNTKGTTIVLMHSTKNYMEMTDDEGEGGMEESIAIELGDIEEIMALDEGVATVKEIRKETVNGYKCQVIEVVYKDEVGAKSTLWISKKLNMPVKVISETPMGPATIELKNIKEGSISKKMFTVPSGYSLVDMPSM